MSDFSYALIAKRQNSPQNRQKSPKIPKIRDVHPLELWFINDTFAQRVITVMKKVSSVILATIVAIASGLLPAEAATPKKGVTIKGEVISATDGRPIDFASVVLSPSKLYSMTDQDGRFTIEGAAAGEITVSVQYYGMESSRRKTK